MKKLIVFDLDGTLAESKSPLDGEMAELLAALLAVARVAVISGGSWQQFEKQLISSLRQDERLRRLCLLPVCGTKFYRYGSGWECVHSDDLTRGEKEKILRALKRAIARCGFGIARTWGEQIEDRGSQITFSALGQQAPLEEKKKWDPDLRKREAMRTLVQGFLPKFSVRLGGATSLDVTKPGVDKGYGIRRLRDALGIGIDEMIFVGDAIFPGGNDYPAKEAGASCIRVNGPNESKRVIEAILACLPRRGQGRGIGPVGTIIDRPGDRRPASGARSSPKSTAPPRRP